MNNQRNIFIAKITAAILFLAIFQVVSSQNLSSELNSKLSASDQKKLEKANELYVKGKKIEDEINPATKEEKKSQFKWLEAADDYQSSNSSRNKIYTANIKTFWKKYTGEKNLLDFTKKVETDADELFKSAQQIRSSADKERKMAERIRLLIQAEKLESKSLLMKEKALFTYLSWPIEYDHVWVTTLDENLPDNKKAAKNEIKEKKITKDTAVHKSTTVLPTEVPNNQKSKETKTGIQGKNKDTLVIKNIETKSSSRSVVPINKQVEGNVGNDSSLYGKIKITEDQVDKFNSFLEKNYPVKYEDYVVNFQSLDYSDINALKEAWYKYQFGSASSDSTIMFASTQDSAVQNQNSIANNSEKATGIGQVTDSGTKSKSLKPADKEKTLVTNNQNKTIITKDKSGNIIQAEGKTIQTEGKAITPEDKTIRTKITSSKNIPSEMHPEVAGGFAFMVQVAACRVALDEKTLKGVYNGNLKITELYEDNWYKYAIGQFSTYKNAGQLRDQSTIPGAFVIAYLKGKRIKITPALAFKKYTGTAQIENLNPALINYRIQIAASKLTLSDITLKNIYNGQVKIELSKENGWNKYYLPAGKTFQEAKDMLSQISIPGAFISAYHKNSRIEVSKATKLTK